MLPDSNRHRKPHGHTYGDGDRYSHAHCERNRDTYSDRYSHAYCERNRDTYSDRHGHRDAYSYADRDSYSRQCRAVERLRPRRRSNRR